MKLYLSVSLVLVYASIAGCVVLDEKPLIENTTIAFMPDVHFHDVYGTFNDQKFQGITDSGGARKATIRTMADQLTSTRLFNENYFAFLAALDDAAKKGIKLIILPGDFSDDGQPLHLQGLKSIIKRYENEFGIEFLMSPGNHDPSRPFGRLGAPQKFLLPSGDSVKLRGDSEKICQLSISDGSICSSAMRQSGYQEINALFATQGFQPKDSYRYWATPFSTYRYQDYQYELAKPFGELSHRLFEICDKGSGGIYKTSSNMLCKTIPDLSYVVELKNNVWLLAIDANVFVPTKNCFKSPSNAGYNQLFRYKPHVIDWVGNVVKAAKSHGKTLIAFSHFPMADFYDGAGPNIKNLFGEDKFQLKRLPLHSTTQLLASKGLKLHVGGHMHFSDTNVYRSANKKVLANIQAPSLAAYVPAYKTLTIHPNNQIEVDTVVIDDVPRFDELFEHYQREYDYEVKHTGQAPWDIDILASTSYREFSNQHIEALTKTRFIPKDWPAAMRHYFGTLNGADFLILSQLELSNSREFSLETIKSSLVWKEATQKADYIAKQHNMTLSTLAKWNGLNLATDFYRLRNAGLLALRDISIQKMSEYVMISHAFETVDVTSLGAPAVLYNQVKKFFAIMKKFRHEQESRHFMIDLSSGDITPLP